MINIRYGMIFVSVGLLISLIQLLYIKILQEEKQMYNKIIKLVNYPFIAPPIKSL